MYTFGVSDICSVHYLCSRYGRVGIIYVVYGMVDIIYVVYGRVGIIYVVYGRYYSCSVW